MKEEIERALIRLLGVIDSETNYISGLRSQIIKSKDLKYLLDISSLEQTLLSLQDNICYKYEDLIKEE